MSPTEEMSATVHDFESFGTNRTFSQDIKIVCKRMDQKDIRQIINKFYEPLHIPKANSHHFIVSTVNTTLVLVWCSTFWHRNGTSSAQHA